jgi:hypothetical protein
MKAFVERLRAVSSAVSIKGSASYHSILVEGNKIFYTRESTGQRESIRLEQLYEVYKKENFIDTKVVSAYITRRTYSPAVAILMAAGLYDADGDRK